VSFASVMARGVHLDQPSALRDLHGVADEAHLDLLEAARASDPIVGPREAHSARAADLTHDGHACRLGLRRARSLPSKLPGPLGLCRVAPGVAGEKHAAVRDLEEAIAAADLDRLTGEPDADVASVVRDADAPCGAHLPGEGPQGGFGRRLIVCREERDRRQAPLACQSEALRRSHRADALVGALGVVVHDPLVELALRLLQ
jgi:hypothetical protein